MKKIVLVVLVLLVCCTSVIYTFADGYPLSIVRHRWQEVITESNHAALRPGSVYDILTHFEQNSGRTRPQFNYFFFDTGLGAADPIYPVFQTGYQESWPQLIKAGLSEENRHIDHFSTGDTPEGCRIQSVYWVRHINEFPGHVQGSTRRTVTPSSTSASTIIRSFAQMRSAASTKLMS